MPRPQEFVGEPDELIPLEQAVRFIANGAAVFNIGQARISGESIDLLDDAYADARRDITLALANGTVHAVGKLVPRSDRDGTEIFSAEPDDLWEDFIGDYIPFDGEDSDPEPLPPSNAFVLIPASLWLARYIDWPRVELSCRTGGLTAILSSICLSPREFALLQEAFPSLGEASSKGGRTPEPWEDFYVALCILADVDGLPSTQAECVRQMQVWCRNNWGKEMSDSTLKDKLRPIYRDPRIKAKK